MRVTHIFAALLMAISAAASSQAGDRRSDGRNVTGWEAVGRLTMANRAMCTGALIAPDLVLTAAHCLYDPHNGRLVKPRDITFEAGLSGNSAKATRTVRAAAEHPGYNHRRGGANQAGVDIAVLRLSKPIDSSQIRPFATEVRPSRGDELGVISYNHVQNDTPAWQHPCLVLGRKGDMVVMNCEVDFGASGAPVFVVEGGSAPRLVSVISSKAEMGNKPVAVGTIVEQALQVLLKRAG